MWRYSEDPGYLVYLELAGLKELGLLRADADRVYFNPSSSTAILWLLPDP